MIYFNTFEELIEIKKSKGVFTGDYIEAINKFISGINIHDTDIRYELVITNDLERAEQVRLGESIGENKGKLVDYDNIEIYYNEATHIITLTSPDRIGLSLINIVQYGTRIEALGVFQQALSRLISKVTIIDVDLYDISQFILSSSEALNSIFRNIKCLRLIDCQIGNKKESEECSYDFGIGLYFEQLELINCKLNLDEIISSPCSFLKKLDIQKLKAPNLRRIEGMFIASELEEVRLYRCEFPKIKSVRNLFLNSNKLKKVDIIKSFWHSPLENTDSMFHNCRALEVISGLSTLHMAFVETAENMFNNCESLKSIGFGDTAFSKLRNAKGMFKDCKSLKYLAIKGMDWADELINVQQMFKGIPEDCEIVLRNKIPAVSISNDFINNSTSRTIEIEKYYNNNYEILDVLKDNTLNIFEKSVLINRRTLDIIIFNINKILNDEIFDINTQINVLKSNGNIEDIKKIIFKAEMLSDTIIMRPNCLIIVNTINNVISIVADEVIKGDTYLYNVVYN